MTRYGAVAAEQVAAVLDGTTLDVGDALGILDLPPEPAFFAYEVGLAGVTRCHVCDEWTSLPDRLTTEHRECAAELAVTAPCIAAAAA